MLVLKGLYHYWKRFFFFPAGELATESLSPSEGIAVLVFYFRDPAFQTAIKQPGKKAFFLQASPKPRQPEESILCCMVCLPLFFFSLIWAQESNSKPVPSGYLFLARKRGVFFMDPVGLPFSVLLASSSWTLDIFRGLMPTLLFTNMEADRVLEGHFPLQRTLWWVPRYWTHGGWGGGREPQ